MKSPSKARRVRKQSRRAGAIRSGTAMVGALVVTTTLGAQPAAAAGPAHKSRYEQMMADVLRAMYSDEGQGVAGRSASTRFDIAPGPLGTALASFEAATGIDTDVAIEAINEIHSPGALGVLAPEQALQRLLSGTGLAYRFTAPAVVRIDIAGQADFVQVSGSVAPTVSSPKFTETLVDTPQSVEIIPSDVFLQQGAQNLTEVLRNTPGITFNAGENGFATGMTNFSLRGFDTSGSIFVDGARDSGSYFRDVFNVEQVEVAKGPAADNGRAGAGGYVNLSTKTPHAETFQRASLSYGFDGTTSSERPRATVDLNQQISDGAAIRLNVLWQDGGVPGRAVAEKNSWGFAPSLALGLDGSTRLLLSYQRVAQDDVPDWGVPGALIEGMVSYNPDAGGEANRSQFYGHATDRDTVTSDAVLARVEHALSSRTRIVNQTRWSNTDREAIYTVPGAYAAATGLVTTQRQAYERDNTAISNLTNLVTSLGTGAVRHSLSAGVEISREESSANRFPSNGVLGNPGSVPIEAPDANRDLAGFVGLVPSQTADVAIDTVAGYAYDTVQLGDRWQASGGVRVERYDVALDSRTAAGEPQGPDDYSRDDVTLSGKAGLLFKPAVHGSIYAAVGVAAQPPASYLSNPDISREGDNAFPGWTAGPNSATADVPRSTNYEVGTKWSLLDERLSADAAVFRTKRSKIAMAGTVDGVPNTFAGYAEQVIQGVELGAAGQITPSWSVFGGLLFMDSERRHSAAVDAARLAANPGDYGDKTTTNGDELAFTPNVTASFWTTYRLPIGVSLGGGLQHASASFLGRPDDAERIIANGNAGELPGHTVVNALVTYEVNSRLTLRFNADNLTNEFYAASSNWNGSRVLLGPARSFVASIDVK